MIVETNTLVPDRAAELAGKAQFVTATIFGKVGRAAMKPIYSRQYETNTACNKKLSKALRAAILALMTIMNRAPPRTIRYRHNGEGHTSYMRTPSSGPAKKG